MSFQEKIAKMTQAMAKQGIDGWLLYDFRRSNTLACEFLEIPHDVMLTRRFFYWLPTQGKPVKIVHRVEASHLDHLPGTRLLYSSWQELEGWLKVCLHPVKTVAMEYSPYNAIPYVSKVDAGTVELVRGFEVDVVSSAELLQAQTVLNPQQVQWHLEAAAVVDEAVAHAFEFIADKLQNNKRVDEYQVQQEILRIFSERGCTTEGDPIVAVNAHAADPHYTPTANASAQIAKEDFILIDLWCKKNYPQAIYADICRVGVAAAEPTARQKEIFDLVAGARDAGIDLVRRRSSEGQPVMGWEVDQCCRDIITAVGYGDRFVHRTGHNIFTRDHGDGAHLDNLETQDQRRILPGTCFSIEPGVYLPGLFGVRCEVNVLVYPDSKVEVTGGIQKEITCLLAGRASTVGD